ncbi:MAG: HipA family kinase [Sphingomonas sp.]|uniref:HipA family kinase n=2 Tax=Pseudomonadota TaxID=1224 RepID=UPI0030F8DF11
MEAGDAGGMVGAILTGTVMADVERFEIDNVSLTYRGSVQVEGGDQLVAIIKDIPAKELANELLAAAIAGAAGLPVPTAILAFAPRDTGIGVGCPLNDGSGGLVFASANVGGTSVRQFYKSSPSPGTEVLIAERLASWVDAGKLYGFDSWIANTDRNAGNLLFGGAGGIWLIDHARGFTGPAWIAADFDASGEYANLLANWLTPLLDVEKRSEMAKDVGDASDGWGRVMLDRLAEAAHVAALLDAGDREAVLTFLADRAAHVPRLASRALGFLA